MLNISICPSLLQAEETFKIANEGREGGGTFECGHQTQQGYLAYAEEIHVS
jgi:hypothetical protein